MSIKALLRKKPIVVTKNVSVKETAKIMLKENIGSVIVVEADDDQKPCGIVTDRDIALRFSANDANNELLIGDIVQPQLITIHQNQGIKDLTTTLRSNRIRRVVVVDEKGNIAGLVSADDLLILLADELQDIKSAIENQVSW